LDGLRQQLFHAFFAQQLPKLDQDGGVAGLPIFLVGAAREELPARFVEPAGHHALVACVEGVLEVQQRDHDAQRHAGPSGIAGNSHTLRLFTEKVQVGHGHTGAAFTAEGLGHPRASICCKGREASTASGWRQSIIWSRRLRKKSSIMALSSHSQKTAVIEYLFGKFDHWPSLQIASMRLGCGEFTGATNCSLHLQTWSFDKNPRKK
jgi:hypothetical protein